MFVVTAVTLLDAAGYVARLRMLTSPGFGTCGALLFSHQKLLWLPSVLCSSQQDLSMLCSEASAPGALQMWPCSCS